MTFINKKTFTLILGLLCAPLLLTGCYEEYEYYDSDLDGSIEEEEFNDSFESTYFYEGWDLDNDGYLSEEELYSGTFEAIDDNADNVITQNEFTVADHMLTDYAGMDYGSFSEWDDNTDGMLDYQEYSEAVGSLGIYYEWDDNGDNLIETNEFNDALYEGWDLNEDGVIDEEEFDFI